MMLWVTILVFGQLLCDCSTKMLAPRSVGKHVKWLRYNTHKLEAQSQAVDIKDKIIELQCYARCEHSINFQPEDMADKCQSTCRQELLHHPRHGNCPSMRSEIFQNIKAQHRLSCLDTCVYDYECPEVQRCCESTCGSICMHVIGLEEDANLPPIPKILRFKLPRGHKVVITIQSLANSTYYFHVEARSHVGLIYSPRKLGPWHWQPVEKIAEILDSKSKHTDISFNLKPGLWYQVRVAAVNSFGFKGYSESSKAFILPNFPKAPKAPADLKVTASSCDTRYCSVKIIWCPSKSNLPIEKYKIIWSLYVKSKDESVISNETHVKEATKFEINHLQPDSSYYIQVQAMSINGGRRLKSAKYSMLYNTTSVKTNTLYPSNVLKCSTKLYGRRFETQKSINSNKNHHNNKNLAVTTTHIMGKKTLNKTMHDVSFQYTRHYGMIVQITGFKMHKEKVFELCPKGTSCEQREYNAIRAKNDILEFSKLNYNTEYVLKIFRNRNNVESTTDDAILHFRTPKCESLRHQYKEIAC